MQQWLKKYKVILILFVYLLSATLLYAELGGEQPMVFLMGLFFVTFSFFKIIHLPEFNASFKRYDVLAKAIPYYARAYPFVEIVLGVMFLMQMFVALAAVITIVILTSTNIGVIQTLKKGEIIECACLGIVFNLPLSHITVFENTMMIFMALSYLFLNY